MVDDKINQMSGSNLTLCLLADEAIFLGIQHYLTMLGATVLIPNLLVPAMGGDKVSPFTPGFETQ